MRDQSSKGWLSFVGPALTATLVVAVLAISVRAQSLDLDHFKCYALILTVPIDSHPPSEVIIADQFSEERVIIGEESRFCTPVEKRFGNRVTPIFNEDHHLTFYKYDPVTPLLIQGVVKVVNQFGTQKFKLENADLLAVPTEKKQQGHHEPQGLNHFKCYFIVDGLPNNLIAVRLKDHFEKAKHKVLEPFLLCNPAKIEDADGDVTPIEDPNAHLVCYKISQVNYYQRRVRIANQFTAGETELFPFSADLVCVPSKKLDFKLL